MAQVKLQFRNTTGNKMVVTRSISCTVKKTGLSQKTLESQLLMTHHGERTSMSATVAQLDDVMPKSLGVSPAILEDVIFCHQEDSFWPMSEPAALKKKFDNIFEAQKYTKAIDALKQLRKTKVEGLKLLKQSEAHAKHIKDKAEQCRANSERLQSEIDRLRTQVEELSQEMEAAAVVKKEKGQQASAALGIVEQRKTKTERARNLQETLDTLGSNLTEMEDSDEWLESTLEKYEERIDEYKRQEDEMRSQYQEVVENLNASRNQLSVQQSEKGRHQAAKETYEGHLKSRVELAREAARNHSMRGYDDDLDDDQINEFVQRVQKLSLEKDRELDRIQKATQEEMHQIQETLDKLGERRTTRTQERVSARQSIESNARKSRQIQQQMDRIKMDEGTKASIEASYQDLQNRLQRLTTEYENAAWDSKLKTEDNHLNEINTEAARLSEELYQSNKVATDRAQLDIQKKEVKEKRQILDTMKRTHKKQLSELVGPDWSPESLEQDFQSVIEERTRSLGEAKKQQQSLVDEINEINSRLKTHRAGLQQKKEERQKCHTAVINSITKADGCPISSIDEYDIELTDLKTELEDLQKEFDGMSYVSEYYVKCLDTVKRHNTCRLCRRSFANTSEKTSAIDKINQEIAKYAKGQLDKTLDETKEALRKADAARTHHAMYNALTKTEIPAIEKEIKKNEEAKVPLAKKLDQRDSEVMEKEAAKQEAESLTQTVNKIVSIATEISEKEDSVARLSSQQKLSGSSMSLSDIKEQSTANDERLRILKAKIAKLVEDKESARSTINNLERDAAVKKGDFVSAKHEMEKKQGFLATIDELRENTEQQRQIITQADEDLEALIPQVSQAEAQREDARQRGRSKEKGVRADKEKLAETVNRFHLIDKDINNYVESGGPAKLKACLRTIKELEAEQKELTQEQDSLTVKVNEIKKLVLDSDNTKRSIADNINYRKTRTNLEKAKREIAEMDTRNADEDYDDLVREVQAAENRYQVAYGKRGTLIGAMGSKDQQLDAYLQEWEVDYHDAATKYRESHVLVKTNEAAAEDLQKYAKAVDQAIMQYHTLKMQEINAIAGELWRSTYQGTDVDTIMIRSDNEAEGSSKRNYNYRVVMVKQDAEMDMRGRCSAGQKVLASIIIRLALAECFGVNCGVCLPFLLLFQS
jgi:DNA repair protein RAD50